jgi:hypothetical protein
MASWSIFKFKEISKIVQESYQLRSLFCYLYGLKYFLVLK